MKPSRHANEKFGLILFAGEVRGKSNIEMGRDEWVAELRRLAGTDYDPETRELCGFPEKYYFPEDYKPHREPDLTLELIREVAKRIMWIDYENHRGERRIRKVLHAEGHQGYVIALMWSPYHSKDDDDYAWIVQAIDLEAAPYKTKDFLFSKIFAWHTEKPGVAG